MLTGMGLINLILVLFLGQSPWPVVDAWPGNILTPLTIEQPIVVAKRSVVFAPQENIYFFRKNAEETQAIASITKLMTAVVFLKNNPGWEKIYRITAKDQLSGGRLNLFPGDELTVRDLFYTSLVASDNGATIALVHASGLSEADFVAKMNEQARQIGLRQTSFTEPTGLSEQNISTAREVAQLAKAAFDFPEIREATQRREYRFLTQGGQEKFVESTDYLLFVEEDSLFPVLAGKTGFTDKAGYCFVGLFKDQAGREVISVVLNSAGKNERFQESKKLIKWVFTNYSW